MHFSTASGPAVAARRYLAADYRTPYRVLRTVSVFRFPCLFPMAPSRGSWRSDEHSEYGDLRPRESAGQRLAGLDTCCWGTPPKQSLSVLADMTTVQTLAGTLSVLFHKTCTTSLTDGGPVASRGQRAGYSKLCARQADTEKSFRSLPTWCCRATNG